MEGQIVKILSNLYFVNSGGKIYECHSRGKFRQDKITPTVGDYVYFDDKNNYILEIDIPGFKKEDIDIEYDNDYLTVKVERREIETNDVKKEYIKKERSMYEQYERSFYIGNIDEKDIKAKFENGILKLTIPKEYEEKVNKKIEIE